MLLRRLVLLIVALCASTVAAAGVQRALLIGVSEYEANLSPLPGARNDVLLIRELLVRKYGFDPANVQIMMDEEGTRAGILAAIANMARIAEPDDIVLIHYSGHGSQAPDNTGDEPDGLDETIVPYDARTTGVPDITDDELNEIIGRIKARSIVVILDSCHSGTGTRAGPGRVSQRWIPQDPRKELYATTATRQVVTLPVSEKHVFFAAAQESESELDGPFGPDNLRLGLFTAAFVGVLVNAPEDVTARQAIDGVSAQIEALKASAAGMPIPEPNMEAPLERQTAPLFVFANPEAPPQPAATQPQLPETLLAETAPPISEVSSVFAVSDGVEDRGLGARIANYLGSNIRLANVVSEAHAVVDQVANGVFDVYGPGGATRVATGLRGNSAGADFKFLEKPLRNAPVLANLLTLQSSPSGLALQMKAAGVSETRSRSVSERSVRVSVNTDNHKLRFYVEGHPRTRDNSLQLELRSNGDCFLTLASVDSTGAIYVLLPNIGQELSGFLKDGRIRGHADVLIPDSLATNNEAGFHFDYAPPGGTDRVIGVCSETLQAANQLRNQLARLEQGDVVSETLLPVATRGLTNVTPGGAEGVSKMLGSQSPATPWAAAILTLDVGL